MGFSYKYIKFFFVLLQSSSIVAGLNGDCDGKAFHCVNITHFKICVDLGGGISKTVDDFLLLCPDNTFCMPTNRYECEYHEATTTTTISTTIIKSDFSEISELSEVSVIPLLSAEKKLETTTAAVKEITEKSSTLSILKNIEDISIKPTISKKDEKLTSEIFFDFNPTESYLSSAEQNFDSNNINKEIKGHYENTTKDFKIMNKTEYSSPKSGSSNRISDKNVTFYNITNILTDNSENNNYTITIDLEKIMPIDNTTIVKILANMPDKLNNTLNNTTFNDNSKIGNETSGKNVNYATLNLSNSTESEKDEEHRVKEPSSVNQTLPIRNISFVKKSKNHENTTEDFHKIDNAEYFIQKNEDASKMRNATSAQNENITSLSTGSEKDENERVYETNSVGPTSLLVEKSIKDDKVTEKDILTALTATNTSSVVHVVLNKTSDKNKEGEKNVLIPNTLLTTNSSLAVHDDYIDTKLNISGSETLDSKPFYEEIEGKDITNVTVTMSPTNNKNNYLQVVTDVNGEQLLDNFMSTSAYPDVIVDNMRNYTFYEKNETTVTSDIVIHNQSKEFESKLSNPGEERSISVINITSFFDDHYLNSSLSLNSESPVDTMIPNVSKLSDKLKIEISDVSNLTNSNNFSVPLNDNKTEITDNVIFTTEESSNRNENKINSEDDKIFHGDTPININVLKGTIQETEVNSPKTKSESVNENDPKLLRKANTLSILQLQTTTEDSEVVKATTNNINQLDIRDDQHQTVIETETVKYTAKNETKHNTADPTANKINKIINSSIIPISIKNFMSLSKFENNLTTVPENEVIKRSFANEKNSDDYSSSITSSTSNSNLSHEIQTTTIYETIITSAASVLNNDEPNKFYTTEPTTENYDTYSPGSPVIHTTKRHVEAQEKSNDLYVYDSITPDTSSIVYNLLTATERYDSSKIALGDLSLTDLRLVLNRNINESRWLFLNENIPSAAVKNDTINFNNAVVYTHNVQNISEETYTTYNISDDSSLFVATTDSYVISTTTSNSYTTKSEIKIGQPNVTNTYFTEEKFVASTLKKSESQISPPSAYNVQEPVDTQTIHSILKTTSIEPYESTTQIEQIYFTEIETDSNMIPSSMQFDKISNNNALPNRTYEDFNPTDSNGTSLKRRQVEFDQQKIMMNATEMDKDFPLTSKPLNRYPIHLLLLSKSNNSVSSLLLHDDNLDPMNIDPTTETMKSVFLTHNASPDNVPDTNDLPNNILTNATEKYQSIVITDLYTHHIDINNAEVSTTTTSVTNPSNRSVPVQLEITTTSSKESKLKQKINRTESSQSTMSVTLIKAERINLSVDENYKPHATKRNTTVNSYNNILEKDLPFNISKKDNITDILLPTRDYISFSNNDSALLKDFISSPKIPLITPLVSQSKGDIISKPPINTDMPVNIKNLTTSSGIIRKVVSDFYDRNSETSTEAKLKIINSQNNNYIKSNTPLDLQNMTNGILRPLSEITLADKTENSSNTLNILKTTAVYEYSTNTYDSEVNLNNNISNTAFIDTISGNKENLHKKLTGKGLKEQLNIIQSIKTDTGNNSTQYLLAQASSSAKILTNNSQNGKEQNATKSNSLNLSDTSVIRKNDALDLKVLPTHSPVLINNVTKNKPITYTEHKNISQGKEIKTNAPILQFESNFDKSQTKFIGININNTMINNFRKPTSLLSNMSSLNKSSVNISILDNAKATTNNGLNSIPVKNTPITYLLGVKSSNFNQTKSYNQTHTVTTEIPKNNAKTDGTKANKCLNQPNGKYADRDDCKKFYLCLGDAMPVLGECPNGTVFSESKKQCTKNLSQCYRNNRFICLSPGRYDDLSAENIYYICVKNRGGFIQFKYQCRNGYILNKTIVKCIKDSDTSGPNNSDLNTKEDSASISVESSSKAAASKEAETLKIISSKKGDTEFECKKEGKYPHPKKCNQYFLCTKIKKSVFHRKVKSCDSGEVFDKEKKVCVDSDSHEC